MIDSKFPLSDKQMKFLEEFEKTDIEGNPILEGTTSANPAHKYDLLDDLLIQFIKIYKDGENS